MQISIFQKILPFSTEPGIKMLIPGTSVRATFYPTRIDFHDLSSALPVHLGAVVLDLEKPESTIQLNLEKGIITVSGESGRDYYRYTLSGWSQKGVLELNVLKGNLSFKGEGAQIQSDNLIVFDKPFQQISKAPFLEKISLGSHRKQDWELVMRRNDPIELFPILYKIAQWIPQQKPAVFEGTASLLPACCSAICSQERNGLIAPFQNLIRVAFEGLLSPTLVDEKYQGYALKPIAPNSLANPLALCVDTALLMRSLFLQTYDDSFKILPALPPEFHSGRALSLRLKDVAAADIEWSKKQLRRMVIRPVQEGELYLQFPKEIDSFRVRRSDRDRGIYYQNSDPIVLNSEEVLYLDHFQK